jgi:GNAT superfamily N-acetyltransferase
MRPFTRVSPAGALRSGILEMPFRFGWSSFRRSMRLSGRIEEVRSTSAPEPHWYLMALGIHPSKQGQGIGSALMQPVLRKADETRTACYLETFAEENIQFYRRFGFATSHEHLIGDRGLRFWTMERAQ